MAQSRFERVGTILTRLQALLKGGGLKYEDRPIWFDIYTAFPPKYSPTFDRPIQPITIREIFYQEDRIRAKFHKENVRQVPIDLTNPKSSSYTKKFLTIYNEKKQITASEEDAFKSAMLAYTSLHNATSRSMKQLEKQNPKVSAWKLSNISTN